MTLQSPASLVATAPPPRDTSRHIRADAAALALGIAVTLALHGYQFGQSNHAVYLLDSLRRGDPNLLARDWFTTGTLQYHTGFSLLARSLDRAGLLPAGFFALYLCLVALLHIGWRKLVDSLGGSRLTYLLSVAWFHLLAGGTGLGMYQFLQDSSLQASNIANVAMLWGLYFWIVRRYAPSGAALGVAGLFHLNHAIVALGLWATLGAGQNPWRRRDFWIGSVIVTPLCLLNVLLVLSAHPGPGGVPLEEFVDLYVRLRHPHHYDPLSWPMLLWLSFLIPLPLAIWGYFRDRRPPRPTAARIFILLAAMQLVALLGAGIWYVSETLVQMSLWRFSIFLKLLSCIGAAWLMQALWPAQARRLSGAAWTACAALAVAGVGYVLLAGQWPLQAPIPRDGPDYLAACHWARDNTPSDAVFLVPPDEQLFRLHARRAIVVNFKGVPQTASQLPQWRDRLEDVLDLDDLRQLPRPFAATLAAMRARYTALSGEDLHAVARRYHARYLLATRPLLELEHQLVFQNGSYFLYDCEQ